jgi:hypothetical protein
MWHLRLDIFLLDIEPNQTIQIWSNAVSMLDFKAYNEKVKSKTFNIGDLVWKVILPMDRRDRVLGKWSPNWEISQIFSNCAYEIEELTPEKRSLNISGKYLKKYKPALQEVKIVLEQ